MENKYVGITMGDPAGIGPEIALKSIAGYPEFQHNTIIYGSYEVLNYYHHLLKIKLPMVEIKEPKEYQTGKINVISVLPLTMQDFAIGEVSAIAGNAAYRYIEKAIHDALAEKIAIVVTAPLNKEALHKGGHNYDGHTEIFATLTKTEKYTMMLWSEKLSVVHVSTHCALREACNRVKKARVLDCIKLAEGAMQKLGIQKPRIAVAGLNPHSGEAGIFGTEEIEEVTPAIETALAEGIDVEGPVSPDTVFLKAYQGKYDIVVAMYHDQGHIPMKVLAFDSGVNVTLGLPIIRTSVDHGTAFDIAGQGIANEESMYHALSLGLKFLKTV
ncbi:MAG TPA: 4-hydroxythreonine-4-phosphate dehydrogenase PdxA [Candidatus Avacidaminococcus intestinavium]|uniref:4-hydroxythreonine-4-phosphate dehydrogenase PdxA n=1 Tax=Candidatus Avacidaminococcus intestinavium TaxID=2840684 RepID=A0A9D1MRB6_9FIRM|nr:4-hydroxythreonine-4-phosphate dehydrogenase PdxA [Candidatus Avacidaminococcus intestinavium]